MKTFLSTRRTMSIVVALSSAAIATSAGGIGAALSAQSVAKAPAANGKLKPLFNGTDFTGWTVAARGGVPAMKPEEAGWKIENGAIVGGRPAPGQRGGTLLSEAHFKDVELELDFMLAEQPNGPDGSCKTCTYNSGVYLRTGYQVNIGRREAGEFIGVVVHRVDPRAIRGNVLWLDTGDEQFPNLRKKEDWNHLLISFKGTHLQVTLNGTQICDVNDNPTDPAEALWKEPGPIGLQ